MLVAVVNGQSPLERRGCLADGAYPVLGIEHFLIEALSDSVAPFQRISALIFRVSRVGSLVVAFSPRTIAVSVLGMQSSPPSCSLALSPFALLDGHSRALHSLRHELNALYQDRPLAS